MAKISYNGQRWQFESQGLLVVMNDATFQKHLNACLASMGLSTMTYLQLLEYVDQVLDQRIEAARKLQKPEYWLDINDPDVRIFKWGKL